MAATTDEGDALRKSMTNVLTNVAARPLPGMVRRNAEGRSGTNASCRPSTPSVSRPGHEP